MTYWVIGYHLDLIKDIALDWIVARNGRSEARLARSKVDFFGNFTGLLVQDISGLIDIHLVADDW